MDEILILSTARKAVLARISALGRRFCDDDINEMVSMTVERFFTRGSYDPAKSAIQTYVSRIASSAVYDFVKAYDRGLMQMTDVRDLCIADTLEADSVLLRSDETALFEHARERLSPKYREYCDLLLKEEYSYEEIAHMKGTTAGNVGVIAYRLREQLRGMLGDVA